MNKIQKYQWGKGIKWLTTKGGNVITTVKNTGLKIKKGINNLKLYTAYTKNSDNFNDAVVNTLNHYKARYPVLDANYFYPAQGSFYLDMPQLSVPKIKVSFHPLTNAIGAYSPFSKSIKIYPYSRSNLKLAWRSPNHAIRNLKGTAAHETAHFVFDKWGIDVSKWSPKTLYWEANPSNGFYNDLLYAFNDRPNRWAKSPEEFIADMSYAREALNIKPGFGFSQWDPTKQARTRKYMSKSFGFTPEDADYFLHQFSQLGFKYGGKIKNPQQ